MSRINEILNDRLLARYGQEDMFKVYYTCFPVDKKEEFYECLKGKFDAGFSDTFFWESRSWKTVSIPKLLPQRYHLPYAQFKLDNTILRIHQK